MTHKPGNRGLMVQVLSRMAAGDSLISDRHAASMLFGLLQEAEKVTDPVGAWEEVRTELCGGWGIEDGPEDQRKPFIYRDGVAVIPVHGILLNRFNHCWGFVTGYDFIRRQRLAAMADNDVEMIVYDHDTPGGEAAGCDELAREIYADRDIKPSLAVVNTLSASGGYWLAAPCSRIVCAPSGSVGSIGVYIQHMMIGKMLAEWGIEVEFIKNGDFKTSGNMFEQLSREDRQYLQDMVDERAVEFHKAVAEFRGIEESVVKDTQARVMRPTEAVSLGLIDAAVSPANAVSDFLAELGRNKPSEESSEENIMATETDKPAEITSEQRAEIAADSKARIKGIMTHEEAAGRDKLAEHLAYDTDNTVEQAAAIMATAPKAEAEPAAEPEAEAEAETETDAEKEAAKSAAAKEKSAFEAAMDDGDHPNVGPDADAAADENDSKAKVARILGAQHLATGRQHGKDKA